jgi:hypothetical protein
MDTPVWDWAYSKYITDDAENDTKVVIDYAVYSMDMTSIANWY